MRTPTKETFMNRLVAFVLMKIGILVIIYAIAKKFQEKPA